MSLLLALLQAPEGLSGRIDADSTSALTPLGQVGDALNQALRRILFLPPQASTIAAHVDQLHYFELGLMSLLAVGLGILGIWFAFRYRRRAEGERTPRIVAPVWLEVGAASTSRRCSAGRSGSSSSSSSGGSSPSGSTSSRRRRLRGRWRCTSPGSSGCGSSPTRRGAAPPGCSTCRSESRSISERRGY